MLSEHKSDARRERRILDALKTFEEMPDDGIVRVGPVARIVGCGTATVWRRARDKTFPAPVKVSAGITGWRVGDVRKYLADPQGYRQSHAATA